MQKGILLRTTYHMKGRAADSPGPLSLLTVYLQPIHYNTKKPLVNSKKMDLTPSLFEKSLRQREKKGNLYHDLHISLRADPRVPQDVTPSEMNN